MKIVSVAEMRALDRAAIERHHIPSHALMERAGRGVASVFVAMRKPSDGPVGILVGKGNNGGDGLVAARHLLQRGFSVNLFHTHTPSVMSDDARSNWERLLPLVPQTFSIESSTSLETHLLEFARCTCLVDALVGTGLNAPLTGHLLRVVDFVNQLKKHIVSIDIPSGLNADTGEIMGAAVKAKQTVTLGLPKRGFFLGAGPEHSGTISVVDIGIPAEEVSRLAVGEEMIVPQHFVRLLKPRPRAAHKGMSGHVLVIAGHQGMLGAGYLSSLGALRVGVGLVTYALPQGAFAKFDARYPEVIVESLPDGGTGSLHPEGLTRGKTLTEKKDAVVLGPGIGTHMLTAQFVEDMVKHCSAPLVVDADALNCLVGKLDLFKKRQAPTIITPHPGEMARLVGKSVAEVQADRWNVARSLAKSYRFIVVLKGAQTVVATPDGRVFINPTGNPGMATAGMGDVLAGMIAGFIAQGADSLLASLAGVYLHGAAGDLAATRGEAGTIASDLLACIPEVLSVIAKVG